MADLEIRIFGAPEVTLAGRPITDLESASTTALLARLAHDPGVRLTRPPLAEMLWPDRPDGMALANLRHSFAVLRRLLGDRDRTRPLFVGTRDTVSLDAGPDLWIDLEEFRRLARVPRTSPRVAEAWKAAVALRRGPLLAGFDPKLSGEWDAWLATSRAEADRMAVGVISHLAGARERAGLDDEARALHEQALAIHPYDEASERSVVRLLARSGRPAEAAAHAEGFTRRVLDDLGVTASPQLEALLEDVRHGRLERVRAIPELPARTTTRAAEPCVARQDELAALHRLLDDALTGVGRIAFVSGSAGSGKSVLLRAFADTAASRLPSLTVLRGTCNAFTGTGDPYLPFRQMLEPLFGSLDRAWLHGELTPAQAEALWTAVPTTVDVLLDTGPHLLGPLIDGAALQHRLERAFPDHPVTARLAHEVASAAWRATTPPARQPVLDEYVRVMSRLAVDRPLLMVIDDLHYADRGTLDLIRHLAAAVRDVPILVVAALRPPEAPRSGPPNPVAVALDEIRAANPEDGGTVALAGSRQFVDAWLDTRPNRLDEAFRDMLFRTTRGHALFTVELVAAMRERGTLIEDEDGRWTTRGPVDWDVVPPRVEALIGARLAELAPQERRVLEVAAIQGETFLAEVVSAVVDDAESDVAALLGDLSIGGQPLLEQIALVQVGDRPCTQYRFRHRTFQVFLDDALAGQDRRTLHSRTARALSELFADRLDDVVVDLARHHDAAGDTGPAIEYHGRAGRRAAALAALADASVHLRRALALLEGVDPSGDRDRQEVDLLLPLGACLQALAGYNAPDTTAVYDRLRDLLPGLGASPEVAGALGALVSVDGLRGRYADALESAGRMGEMAEQLGAPPIGSAALMQQGWLLMMTARLEDAEEHLDAAISTYDPEWDPWLVPALGMHVRSAARAWRAIARWIRGHPDAAHRDAEDAIAEARAVGHPFTLVLILAVAGCAVDEQIRDGRRVLEFASEMASIAQREDFTFYRAAAQLHRGLGLAMTGAHSQGFADIEAGLDAWADLGTKAFRPWIMSSLAESLVDAGEVDWAERVVSDIDQQQSQGEERLADCFAPVPRARVLRARGEHERAEAILRQAADDLDRLGARGPLLRTATVLAELLCDDGRHEEAAAMLQPIRASFDKGADTPDVIAADAVLARALEQR